MQSRPILPILFGLLAAAAAVVFLAIAIDNGVYAPGAHRGGRQERILAPLVQHAPVRFKHDLTPRIVVRKIYSVIAFAIVGLLAAPLIAAQRRIGASALLVGGFSLIIEIAQRATVSQESNLFSLFDIGCGAVGGVIGAVGWNVMAQAFRRRGAS